MLATPILSAPRRFGETGAVYLPARRRYMMIRWYFSACSGHFSGASKETIWEFYEAPHPWVHGHKSARTHGDLMDTLMCRSLYLI